MFLISHSYGAKSHLISHLARSTESSFHGKVMRKLCTLDSSQNLKIRAFTKAQFAHNSSIYNALIEIARPSYQDPETILQKDWDDCDRLYLGFQNDNELRCFFMVGRHVLEVKKRSLSTVYLGLSCVHQKSKNQGLVLKLFNHFIAEAQKWEKEEKTEIPLWYTAATPSTFHGVSQCFRNSQPFIDGTYTSETLQIVEAIKKQKNWLSQSATHPFVVKGVTTARYSESENERIAKIIAQKKFSLLSDLDIQEKRGDRWIGVCYLPLQEIK